MNKGELIGAVAKDAGVSEALAGTVLDSIIDAVTNSLKKGDRVALAGFGTFSIAKRKARSGRNPQTGKPIKIPAKKVAKFKGGARLAKAVKCDYVLMAYKRQPKELGEGGDKKTKLQATYSKNADGSIKVSINVVDRGDFPTPNIFDSASQSPSDEAWSLEGGKESTISKTLPSSDEAKQWVLSQVKALKQKLDHWRDILVPGSEEFEI